ncbi:hypothetical protein [Longispora fulva]|uniref:Uncharacterized protein n=1 Tax=Longispora fulva TaxID=619741 RepID=A0A8J7GWP0_9ACTN|nr:hypothetical protein [Longispora fulva]MBG6140249.1 hypothetical protein [Longispora fulva]
MSIDLAYEPVGWVDARRMHNAAVIVRVGQQMGLSRRAQIIAVATAMQESALLNQANGNVPHSLELPHEQVGWDHDSVGLFQQRCSPPHGAGSWGTPEDLMNPAESARRFYSALVRLGLTDSPNLSAAAQAVQGSAFPSAYAKHEGTATRVVDSILAAQNGS